MRVTVNTEAVRNPDDSPDDGAYEDPACAGCKLEWCRARYSRPASDPDAYRCHSEYSDED